MKHKIVLNKKWTFIISSAVLTLIFSVVAFLNRPAFDCSFDIIFYIIVFFFCLAALSVSFFLLFVKKWPVHKVFLAAFSAIGLLSLLVNTPGTIPDEMAHIKNAYLWSNRMLGITDTCSDQQISKMYINYDSSIRKEDLAIFKGTITQNASATSYIKTLHSFKFRMASEDSQLIPCTIRDNGISPIGYYPAILGLTIARLLNLGTIPMLYLAKLFMLAFYIFGLYWAIQRIPFGKSTLFVIAILPMSIFLSASFSYDTVIIALSMMLIAQILYLAYGDILKIGIIDVVTSAALVFLLSPLKAYLPIALLFFIIPRSRFHSRMQYFGFCFSMLAVGIASILIANLSFITSICPNHTLTNQYISDSTPAYTIDWVLNNPLKTIIIILRTTVCKAGSYAMTMLGARLGWLNIPISGWIIDGIFLCLLATCLKEEGEEIVPSKKQRLSFVLSSALIYVAFLLGMLVWWTKSGEGVIEGVQGRYFIPVLPLILFSLYGLSKLEMKKGFSNMVIMVSVLLTLTAFSSIAASILAV